MRETLCRTLYCTTKLWSSHVPQQLIHNEAVYLQYDKLVPAPPVLPHTTVPGLTSTIQTSSLQTLQGSKVENVHLCPGSFLHCPGSLYTSGACSWLNFYKRDIPYYFILNIFDLVIVSNRVCVYGKCDIFYHLRIQFTTQWTLKKWKGDKLNIMSAPSRTQLIVDTESPWLVSSPLES